MFGFLFRKNSKRPIVTFTGESVQPVRLHYAVLNPSKVLSNLHSLNCMEQTIVNQRFQWFFAHEVKNGPATFEPRQQPKSITAIGFVFFSKDGKKLIVRVLSHDRALFAIKFFDHYFSRKHLRLEYMDVYNRIFNASLENLRMVKDTDLLFPEAKTKERDTETLPRLLEQWAAENLGPQKTIDAISSYLSEMDKQPVPEIERIPVYFYKTGINAIRKDFILREIVAFEHFKGNKDYRMYNALQQMMGR